MSPCSKWTLWGGCLALVLAGACRVGESAPAKGAEDDSVTASSAPAVHGASPAKPTKAAPVEQGPTTIHAKTTKGGTADISVQAPAGWRVAQPPTTPDPHHGKLPLAEALRGVKGRGQLVARISTTLGDLYCDLYEDKAPNTVANFVGLARGVRKLWDETAQAWTTRRYYDGTTFHRVIPGFMIQGGDFKGDGSGRLWFSIPDELHPSLKHDRSGLLCMANRGPNTNEAQFFITEGAAPHLDGSYTIFGQCEPTELVYRIARVPQAGPPSNRPLTPIVISRVDVMRIQGGAKVQAPWAEVDPGDSLPRNSVPGVAPPGRAVEVQR